MSKYHTQCPRCGYRAELGFPDEDDGAEDLRMPWHFKLVLSLLTLAISLFVILFVLLVCGSPWLRFFGVTQ